MSGRLLLVALAFAVSADAGVIYHFTTKFTGRRYEFKQAGRVWVERDRYRFEIDPDPSKSERPYDVAISTDGDVTAKLLNTTRQTWYERRRAGKTTRSSMLFDLPMAGGKVGRRMVHHFENGTTTIAGRTARKHVIEIDYEIEATVGGHPVRGSVVALVHLWTCESLPRLPLERPLKTGHRDIDAELASISSKIKGMVLRHELTVTRTLAGGEKVTETVMTIVDDVAVAEIDPAKFEVPAGYRYEKP